MLRIARTGARPLEAARRAAQGSWVLPLAAVGAAWLKPIAWGAPILVLCALVLAGIALKLARGVPKRGVVVPAITGIALSIAALILLARLS